jgi:hypothetical protein
MIILALLRIEVRDGSDDGYDLGGERQILILKSIIYNH